MPAFNYADKTKGVFGLTESKRKLEREKMFKTVTPPLSRFFHPPSPFLVEDTLHSTVAKLGF